MSKYSTHPQLYPYVLSPGAKPTHLFVPRSAGSQLRRQVRRASSDKARTLAQGMGIVVGVAVFFPVRELVDSDVETRGSMGQRMVLLVFPPDEDFMANGMRMCQFKMFRVL